MSRHNKPWLLTADDAGRRVILASYDHEREAIAARELLSRAGMGFTDLRVSANASHKPQQHRTLDQYMQARDENGRLLRCLTVSNEDAKRAAEIAFDLGRQSAINEVAARVAARSTAT